MRPVMGGRARLRRAETRFPGKKSRLDGVSPYRLFDFLLARENVSGNFCPWSATLLLMTSDAKVRHVTFTFIQGNRRLFFSRFARKIENRGSRTPLCMDIFARHGNLPRPGWSVIICSCPITCIFFLGLMMQVLLWKNG